MCEVQIQWEGNRLWAIKTTEHEVADGFLRRRDAQIHARQVVADEGGGTIRVYGLGGALVETESIAAPAQGARI